MAISDTDVIDYLEKFTTKEKMSLLYREEGFLNKYLPVNGDTKNPHDDVIAEYLLKHLYLFDNDYIPKIDRGLYGNGIYIQEGHGQLAAEKKGFDDKSEDYLAQNLYGSIFEEIGEIIDFQIPIGDNKYGKIDLLAYNKNNSILSIIELKREDSKETLLRAILEISTYYLQIDREKLKKELERDFSPIKQIKKIVLFFKDNPQLERFKKPDL